MAIYACAVLAGIVGLRLMLSCTFGSDTGIGAVSIFGLRAPLGVFIAGWGGLAMLTSAPFDNWWHNAYGLDVKIISPPHVVLILGIRAVSLGMLLLILSAMNRAADAGTPDYPRLRLLFLYLGGIAVSGQMFFLQEYTWDIKLHQGAAYIAMGIGLPLLFAAVAQASRFRWSASAMAAVYTLYTIAQILVLPLFAAEPKLGPVFHPITHFVPTKFPILILFPALALDLLWSRETLWKPWLMALASGALFVATLAAVEWPFASFLLSSASQNRFFGTIYFDYASRPESFDRMRVFLDPSHGSSIVLSLLIAAVCAAGSAWVGLSFGSWMRTVRR